MKNKHFISAFILMIFPIIVSAQVASGGSYSLEKTVVTGGGSDSTGGTFSLTGTVGQNPAGTSKVGLPYTEKSGFWTPEFMPPTAAIVSVSGQIRTVFGNGIKNVIVTITNSVGQSRTAITGSMGYYRFTDIEVGDTYVISVSAKKFEFSNPVQFILVNSETSGIDFVADN